MVIRFLASGALLTACMFAQVSSFPKPSYFRETFARHDSKVELQSPVRLNDYVVAGKLELSLKSFLDLVMANNTDIQIQKLTVETPKNAILRAFGTFDPLATASFNAQHNTTPVTNAIDDLANTAGVKTKVDSLTTLSEPARFGYSQTLPTGTQYNVNFTGTRNTTTSSNARFNPTLNSSLGINITQPLIKNRGAFVNRLSINIARSRLRKSEYDLHDAVMRILNDSENAYWDVIQARENLRVQESAKELAGEALKRAQRELELGAMSPLDIFNPQQQYATAEIGVSQARFRLAQVEDALRKQIAADLDPEVRKLPIVLTETVMPSAEDRPVDAEAEVQKALHSRPDLKSQVQDLDTDDLSIRQIRNNMRPDLSFTASYTATGTGGPYYPSGPGAGNAFIAGGFGDTLSQMFGFGYPIYSFGVTLRLPIRDRRTAADLADAFVNRKNDKLQIRATEQTVRLDVLQAISNVESSKAAVKLAVTAQDFARKYLEAEQKKYELGTSQIFFVLQAQSALVAAESTVVQNAVQYRRNVLNLLRKTGELLDVRNVKLQ